MKSRTLKLREAHKVGENAAAVCSILWDKNSDHFVTSSSSDASISIHDGLSTSTKPLQYHQDVVTALALSHDSTRLASGSMDRCVKLYESPSGEYQRNLVRFGVPIRVLAFDVSGSLLAAAGDDGMINLINTINGTVVRVLQGHKVNVTGLDFDPNGEFLASIDSSGSVFCCKLASGAMPFTLKGLAPNTGYDGSIANVLRWSPNGRTLAVPLGNEVVMYDRTWKKLFALEDEHVNNICYLAWAPNGKYIATSGLDKQVLIWDVDKKQVIDRQEFEQRISCMAWKPNVNALSVIDIKGSYGIWEPVIPSSMTAPTVDIPNKSTGLGEELSAPFGSLNDASVDSDGGESHHTTRGKRLKRKHVVDDYCDANEDLDDGSSLAPASRNAHRAATKYKMQSPFQPGATPQEPGKETFLCYNMLGCITTMELDGRFLVKVGFHDIGKGPRVPPMIDYYGFTMASINENGCVFASPCKGEENMSVLMYQPFIGWTTDSEWKMRFDEGEEVKVVANGSGWVAAVTSLNLLRIFSEGGLQKHVITLDGPVVSAVGCKDKLAVVFHVSEVMKFRVYNISRMTQQLKGRVALTLGSCLTWIGFSEEGALSSYDSEGVLRVFLTSQFVAHESQCSETKSEENYWAVGLDATSFYCIACERHPQVTTPKPFLSAVGLSLPLATSNLQVKAASLENKLMLTKLRSFEITRKEHMERSIAATTKYKMQSPFQPGATPQEPGKQTFLCYNMLGWITRTDLEGRFLIKAGLHSDERGLAVRTMPDSSGFTMASISENGCVFATPNCPMNKRSVVIYQPFRTWDDHPEWIVFGEDEEVQVVANGSDWFAVVTSLNLLRIYGEGCLLKHAMTLDGPVVSAVGRKNQLALVFHVSKVMKFRVLNISRMTQKSMGSVALTLGSCLTWIGFSEEGALSSYDSEGVAHGSQC